MKYILTIDEGDDGIPVFRSLSMHTLEEMEAGYPNTPAAELGDFLQAAADVWLKTRDMDQSQALQFVQSLTASEFHTRSNPSIH
jgi:hypothetical protein